MAEVTLAGLTLTQDEWEALDLESRALLLDVGAVRDAAILDEPYDSYEVTLEKMLAELFE
jgi:hypothetical protein